MQSTQRNLQQELLLDADKNPECHAGEMQVFLPVAAPLCGTLDVLDKHEVPGLPEILSTALSVLPQAWLQAVLAVLSPYGSSTFFPKHRILFNRSSLPLQNPLWELGQVGHGGGVLAG